MQTYSHKYGENNVILHLVDVMAEFELTLVLLSTYSMTEI